MLLGGRYDIGERLGVGGSAEVYRAHDERLDRDVAVKLLSETAAGSADPVAVRRFEIEARNAATFVHPHAVTIYDAGTDQGYLYIVMELVTGGSLAQRMASAPMTSSEVRTIGIQLAGALDAAHSAGIIHRDVKPSNVLLDADGNAKLADFGIARRLDEIEDSMTSTGMVMGTRSYVSPEQAAGHTLGQATDVFSLGVTLYEAATGVRPPAAVDRTPGHVLDPMSVVPGLDAGLAAVIATASAVAVERRFSSAAALTAALNEPTATEIATATATATATMPVRLRPHPPTDELGATRSPQVPAVVSPTDPRSALSHDLAKDRRRRSIVAVTVAVLVVLGSAGIAVALARSGGGTKETVTSMPTADEVLDQDTAGTVDEVDDVIAESVPPTSVADSAAPTDAPATVAETTEPPIETTIAPAAELIAGFPIPADAEGFLASLEADPDLVGERGSDLAKEFEQILGDRGDRGNRAEKLRDKIAEWVDDEEIDLTIARTALDFLDERAQRNDDSADDDSDDDDSDDDD